MRMEYQLRTFCLFFFNYLQTVNLKGNLFWTLKFVHNFSAMCVLDKLLHDILLTSYELPAVILIHSPVNLPLYFSGFSENLIYRELFYSTASISSRKNPFGYSRVFIC
jgi:hypothetical protein